MRMMLHQMSWMEQTMIIDKFYFMKTEEWFVLIIFVIATLITCSGSDIDNGTTEEDYQEINRSINGVAL